MVNWEESHISGFLRIFWEAVRHICRLKGGRVRTTRATHKDSMIKGCFLQGQAFTLKEDEERKASKHIRLSQPYRIVNCHYLPICPTWQELELYLMNELSNINP